MILSMAGCKGVLPGNGPPLGTPGGLQRLQSMEPVLMDVNRNMSQILALPPSPLPCSQGDVRVDEREVYFLVMHFLANSPCKRAFGQLWNELLQYRLLPRRYHGRFSRDGQPSGDENDDGLSFPLSYSDVANRNQDIPNSHLVDLLRQLLVNSSRSVSGLDSLSKVVSAADTPTLLGSGTFSLLDSVRKREQGGPSRWNLHMRWPHWHADQVSGLMLREIGGGFARHHRSPSVRTASYVVAKPSVFFSRIKPIKKLLGHRNAVYCAIFDRNGQHVITGSDDRLVKIWSTETGFCLRSCRGHEGDITDLAVSSNNQLVASASNDFSIRVWKMPNGFPVSVLRGHGGAVTAIKFSPRHSCEHHLLSSSDDGTCRIWDARDSAVNSRIYMPDPKDPQNAARGAAAQAPSVPPPGNQILCCAFNADGSVFVTGSSDKLARVWNATKWNDEHTGRPNYELDTLQGHENDVNYVQFSGCAAPTRSPLPEVVKEEYQTRFKNTWLAHDSIVTCSRDGSAIIWTPKPRRHHAKAGRWVKAYHLKVPPPPMPPQPPKPGGTRQRLLPTPRGVNMVVWSLDNRFVLAAIMDCRICVWNAGDGSLVHSLTGHDKQTYVLDVHPFNPRIAMSAGYDGRVIIWDIWDGHPVRIYETGDYKLVDGNFSPDGSGLVVSDEVGQIYLFATGEGNSQKDAKYDQFFLGDFRPLVRDIHGNVLDQETQLPPHQRNIQDLLCNLNMIPYAEPYQSLYQQRRLGALGIDWQPPAVQFQIGILDDPPYAGPPEAPPALPPPVVVRSPPDVRERRERALVSEGGNRWVEQPNEVGETVDWDQEAAGMTEDSGSDYSASEDGEDDVDERGDTMDEGDSEDEEEEDEDEVRGDITIRLRRSKRNKRTAQPLTVTYSSSGRRLKRKRYDDGGDTQERRSLRRRKGKRIRRHSPPRRQSPARRTGAASSSRHSNRNQPEPSTRPKRQAAKNALHLLSSINDEEEEEQPVPQAEAESEEHVPDDVEKASGSGQRVLRSRAGGEAEEAPPALLTQGNKVDMSDRGEFSRRPRSQRKLVVKLRSAVAKAEPEDSKVELMDDPQVETAAARDRAENSPGDAILEDHAGPSDNPSGQRHVPKLVIKHPKPAGGHKRNAAVIESSEENHEEDGSENDVRHRRLGCQFESDDEEGLDSAEKPTKEQESWQWKKGKAAKRARGDHPEELIHGSGSSNSGSGRDEQREGGDENGASGSLQRSPTHVLADPERFIWENGRVLATDAASLEGAGEGETSAPLSASHYIGDGEHAVELNDIPCSNEAPGLEIGGTSEHQQQIDIKGPDTKGLCFPRSEFLDNLTDAEKSKQGPALEGNNEFIGTGHQVPPEHGADGVVMNDGDLAGTSAGAADGLDNDAVLLKERASDIVDNDLGPGGLHRLDGNTRSRSGFGSEMDTFRAEDGVGPWEASRRITSSHYSDNEGKDSPAFGGKESSPHGRASTDLANLDDQMDMMEGEADNDPGSQGHGNESLQKSDSNENNSESELFESNGNSGRHWDDLGDNRDTDEESVDGRQKTRHTRQRALGELHHFGRQESNNRHEAGIDTHGKTRIRNLNSVLNEGGRELRSRTGKSRSISSEPTTGLPERSTRRRTKDSHPPWQNGAGPGGWGSRTRQASHNEGPGPGPGSRPARYGSLDSRRGGRGRAAEESISDQEELFDVDNEGRRVVRLENLREDTRGGGRQPAARDKRTSGRTRPQNGRREQIADMNRKKTAGEGNIKDGRDRRSLGKPDRKMADLSWLLLTDVEAGTRYIPQFADDVVYLRQGHEEYLDKEKEFSLGKGPWNNRKSDIRAVEFCRITELAYSILRETGHTCCELTLKFMDQSSRRFGKSFKLTLPELTDDADFIVEKSRYDAGLKKGWHIRDKCQVWWRSDDDAGGGKWWDGRITSSSPKSPEYPDSPWEQFTVLYSMESNEPERHSPWELFEPGNHFHDPPHIDDDSKEQLLTAITRLEESCYVGKEDEFGLRRLMQDVESVEYRNRIPLPLDLQVVKQRLKKGYYHSLEAFRHDVQLLVENTDTFHGEDSEMAGTVRRLCNYLRNVVTYDEEPVSSAGNGDGSEDEGSDGESSENISSEDEDDA